MRRVPDLMAALEASLARARQDRRILPLPDAGPDTLAHLRIVHQSDGTSTDHIANWWRHYASHHPNDRDRRGHVHDWCTSRRANDADPDHVWPVIR